MKTLLRLLVHYPMHFIVAALLAFVTVQGVLLQRERAAHRASALSNLFLRANADTTRKLNAKQLAAVRSIYGDSIRAVEKLVAQTKLDSSKLGRALGQETKLTAALKVQVDSLSATLRSLGAVVADGQDVRHATFQVDSIRPYHVRAEVDLPKPAPGMMGTLRLGVTQDPIELRAHAGCLPRTADGVRPASITLLADSVYTVRLGAVSQDEDVCNPVASAAGRGIRVPWWTVPAGWGVLRLLEALIRGR